MSRFNTNLNFAVSVGRKTTVLKENTLNPLIEVRQAVAREALKLAENNPEAVQVLADLVDSALSVSDLPLDAAFSLIEEIKIGILSIHKPTAEKIVDRITEGTDFSKDLNPEQAYIMTQWLVAIRKLGGSAATHFMKSFKNHPNSALREEAVFFTPDEGANEVIKAFLNDSNPVVQDQLVVKSVEAGNKSALQELLKSSDIVVRRRAEAGLKILQSSENRPDLQVFLDTRYSSWISAFKDDPEIQKGIADRLLVNDGANLGLFTGSRGYVGIIENFFREVFLEDRHRFLHLDPEGVTLHLVRRIGDMKKYYAEAMKLFFEGGESWDGRSPPPGLRQVNAKIKQAVLEGMSRRPSEDLIELAGNEYFHKPFNGDKTSQKSIVQMANLRGGVFQERIFSHYTNPYWLSFPEVDNMIVEGLKQVKASDWNDSYQSILVNLIQRYKDNDSLAVTLELKTFQ